MGVGKYKQNWVMPGWNDHVAELHVNARDCYLIWRNNSKPRHGLEYEDKKLTRARFKLALRECRRNEELMKADAMANKLKHNDCTGLWKEVHTHNCKKKLLYQTIQMAVLDHLILLRCGEATYKIYLITYTMLQIQNLSRTELIASVIIISQLLVALKRP